MSKIKQDFVFKSRDYNPEYTTGLKEVPLRSCLKRNNAKKSVTVKTVPKWLTTLTCSEIDTETGEVSGSIHYTNDFKAGNARKIKALDAFCGHFQPLFASRKVTLLFHTFTQANQANMDFRDMLQSVKYHYQKMMGLEVLGFIWTMEISERLHMHYHLCVAVNRFKVRRIPDELKFEALWGRRTGVEFVKKNVRRYMAKYFAKNNARGEGWRSYGRSRNFDYPQGVYKTVSNPSLN